MIKKKINNLIIKIFCLNKDEILKLKSKNLELKKLSNYDSLKFIKFLTIVEKKLKISIKEENFSYFTSNKKIYKFLKSKKL
jgi:acyl carrier protein